MDLILILIYYTIFKYDNFYEIIYFILVILYISIFILAFI